ncbi:Transposase for insertion sequence element D [Bacillus cereus Rock4-18]|nr:Transposase for insertion sequence element D [Bacillus cereus Rock4-18]
MFSNLNIRKISTRKMDTINEEYEIKVIDEFLIKYSGPIKGYQRQNAVIIR